MENCDAKIPGSKVFDLWHNVASRPARDRTTDQIVSATRSNTMQLGLFTNIRGLSLLGLKKTTEKNPALFLIVNTT